MQHTIPVVGFVSLGCPKALVDTERIVTELRARGYRIGRSYHDADLVIVNTCGFVNEAVEESLEAITEALKENGRVIVCGCLGGRKEADGSNFVLNRMPKILGVTGPDSVDEVIRHGRAPPAASARSLGRTRSRLRRSTAPKHYAYLKISEGCNHHCTFCIIPNLRGRLVSRPIGDIVREAANLKEAGVKELIVISQDTAAYGVDTRYKLDFATAVRCARSSTTSRRNWAASASGRVCSTCTPILRWMKFCPHGRGSSSRTSTFLSSTRTRAFSRR